MSAPSVYSVIREQLHTCLAPDLPPATCDRIALLVMGILGAKSASPARIARALCTLGLVGATVESTERRIRRIENDPQITAAMCLHPLCRHHLAVGQPKQLLLILDPTTQEDRLVMLSVAVWYRGRALPLCWAVWPGNQMLEGERFWERVQALLESVGSLLPLGVPVIWLADRAFGTPTFLDRLQEQGYRFVVRVQDQTRYRDARGGEAAVRSWGSARGQRRKGSGEVFKKQGWRRLSLGVFWGRKHRHPLCLVSNLAPSWNLIALYQRRYPIEALFRDYKASGWQWEQGQVSDLQHLQRLLVGMALATWMALFAGTLAAQLLLREAATGGRRTRAWGAKYSLFQLGLEYLHHLIYQGPGVGFRCVLGDWEAPSWQRPHHAQQVYAFIFGRGRRSERPRSRHN